MDGISRRLPIGAEVIKDQGVHFRLWADRHTKAEIVLEGGPGSFRAGRPISVEMKAEDRGYFSIFLPEAEDGTLYRIRLDRDELLLPDPASRFQPEGPHGPSRVVDPSHYAWADSDWRGIALPNQVIYEMHIGTFTREGTFRAAASELPELASQGITVIEMMPVADFPGRYGWGYDGVDLFAPTRLYGEPDDFRYFVDTAHSVGLGVILDVVFNHVGPDGNYLGSFSQSYFTARRKSQWGNTVNFDGPQAAAVREFFIANAGYWIDEFHLDGLRIDSVENIFDDSFEHILIPVTKRIREAAGKRRTLIIAENESQQVRFIKPYSKGGYGMDAVWNDDFHHSAMVVLSGHKEAYYTDYSGKPQEFISAAKRGFLYQGQYYTWQTAPRGTPTLGLPPAAFVTFIQNHDQIANSGYGRRAHQITSPGLLRAMTALMLLSPGTPMIFQGQEFAASTPFFYFSDLAPEISRRAQQDRLSFLAQFPSLAQIEMRERIADATAPETFERSKLDFRERMTNRDIYALHRDLLRLRREDPVFRAQGANGLDGAVLSDEAFLLRFFGEDGDDRLVSVNFGSDLDLSPAPEPLLAPPPDRRWKILWNSEDVLYGGLGTPIFHLEEKWKIPARSTIVLAPGMVNEYRNGR
ncbi:MAG TPA: malto-oligosyltrehalose trehalohydrolase [Syntrophorhabdaceae bacterium]|jgi:maltooligosyltrehalose trehalohydrolase